LKLSHLNELHGEAGRSTDLQNVGILPLYYMASQPQRPRLELYLFTTMLRPSSPCRWRQHGPPKRHYPTTKLHGVTTLKISTWIFAAVNTSKSRIRNKED